MKRENREFEIDLLQLLRSLWESAKYVLLVTVIFGLLGFAGSSIFMEPVYEASGRLIVNTKSVESDKVTNDQINSAKNLVSTYAVIIRGRDVVNQVIDELKLPETYGMLVSGIRVQSVNNTQVMQITVQHKDPQVAYDVTAKLLEITPDVIMKTEQGGSVKPVQKAYLNPSPISPNIMRYSMILAMAGFGLSCAVVILMFLIDSTYKTDTDIQEELEVPVLGVIPTVESCRAHYGYSQKGKGRTKDNEQ